MKNKKGQALTETILVIPILSLLAFGLIQFAVFFSAKSAFEYACGQMARQYACGRISEPTDLSGSIWNGLGSYQRFFNAESLRVSASPFSSIANRMLGTSLFTSTINNGLLNYSGQTWIVTLQYNGLPFSRLFMPQGVQMQTQLAALRYPGEVTP